MKAMEAALDRMLDIHRKHRLTPRFKAAVEKLLQDHAQVERVDPKRSRFAQIAQQRSYEQPEAGRLGKSFDELIANIKVDLQRLRGQTEELNTEFRSAIAAAEEGKFAALILSGRSAFPDRVMQNEELIGTFQNVYSRACMVTIVATMQVFPDGLEWLKQ